MAVFVSITMQRVEDRPVEQRVTETIERMAIRIGIELTDQQKRLLTDLLTEEFENLEFSAYYDGLHHKDC